MAVPIQNRRITLDEFHRMLDSGTLAEDDRVELIQGEIVEMSPIHPPHNGCVLWLGAELSSRWDRRFLVSVQGALILDDEEAELYPDLMVLRRRPVSYRQEHPRGEDVLLVIEVADSSLARDRKKMSLFAAAGIPEAWLIAITDDAQAVFVHRRPRSGRYQEIREYRRGEAIELEGESFAVDEILG